MKRLGATKAFGMSVSNTGANVNHTVGHNGEDVEKGPNNEGIETDG